MNTGFAVLLLLFYNRKLVLKSAYVLFYLVDLRLRLLAGQGKVVIIALGHGDSRRLYKTAEPVKLGFIRVVLGQPRHSVDEGHVFGMKASCVPACVQRFVQLFKASADGCKLHFFN